MQVKAILQEIERLPLRKRFMIVQQALKSIEKEENLIINSKNFDTNQDQFDFNNFKVNEKSLSEDWLSEEDHRWDQFLL